MVMVNLAETAACRGEAAGAMVLSVEKMEHGGGKDENKKNDHRLFQMHFEMSAKGTASTELMFLDILRPPAQGLFTMALCKRIGYHFQARA